MKKDLKRQIITALAVTAVLGAAGGMTAQAADEFHWDKVLPEVNEKGEVQADITSYGYIYGVAGGDVYLDQSSKDVMETILPNAETILEQFNKKDLGSTISGIQSIVGEGGRITSIGTSGSESDANVSLKLSGSDQGEGNKTRFYGAIGGDIVVNGNMGFSNPSADDAQEQLDKINAAIDSMQGIPGQEETVKQLEAWRSSYQALAMKSHEANTPLSTVVRHGNSTVSIDSGSVIGGAGGSAALGIGNISGNIPVYLGEHTEGMTITTGSDEENKGSIAVLDGSVETNIAKNANVIGWMNGGLAAGIGSKAISAVTGNSYISITGGQKDDPYGKDAQDGENGPVPDLLPQVTNILDAMKGSGISAIGVTGGGAAVTTIGGTATADVKGSTQIDVDDAAVIGVIGGGAAASVDATGVVEALGLGTAGQVGNNDGISDTSVAGIVDVTVHQSIEGGTASATTGNTNISLNGSTTAVGVLGGGAAIASHTYEFRKGGAGESEHKAWKNSIAETTTGKSTIVVETNGKDASAIGDAVKNIISLGQNLNTEGAGAAADLSGLNDKGVALGLFGGGAAFGQGSLRAELSEGNGATAVSNTNGSDILLNSGYAAGVFGGGAAVTLNLARAEANMTDDINIATADGMKTIGIFGGGLALSMEGEVGLDGYRAPASETLANSTVGTVNITNYGDTDGIFGGGMAIGNSNRNGGNKEYNDAVSSVQTSNITVNAGTIDNLNLGVLMEATKNNDAAGNAEWNRLGLNASGALVDLKGITDETSIAAGGLGLGMSGEASVKTANVTVNDGTVKKDILGGGIAVDNIGGKGSAHVGTSTVNLNGGTVEGSIYAGGAVNGTTPTLTGSYDASGTASTVNTAVVNLNGTAVTGEISGQGYQLTTEYGTEGNYNPYDDGNSVTYTKKGYESVTKSILNVSGTNTLTPLDNADGKYTSSSKIHDFDAVNFKAGSETVVDKSFTTTGPALISGGKVTVEDGASLNIDGLDKTSGNTYQIAANTDDASTFWDDSDLIYDRMNGVYATAKVDNGEEEGNTSDTSFSVTYDKIDTTEEANAAADSMTDALGVKDLRGMFREGMNDGWKKLDKDSGAGKYLDDWQLAENKTPYQKGMLFGEDAAVTGNTVSIARAMADNVTQRLSFTDDYVQEQGWANQDGGVWAKYMHRKYETDGMSSSVGGIRSGTDYDGVLVGMDLAKNGKFQSGVAIHYGSGEGDGLISHNDYDAWGITLYGSLKDEEAGTNLMADIGWMTSDNDIDGTVAGTRMSADRDVDAWTIGIRGEKEFVSGKNQIVPYAGLRYMSVNPGSYTTYYDGQAAFHNDAENQDLWLLPIGVSFRNETVTNSGWRITPKLDLSYIWAFGDTDTDMTVNAGGYTGNLYYDVMDDSSWLATLGVEAEKDAWTFGINYGYQKGDDTKNKTWYVTAGYSF